MEYSNTVLVLEYRFLSTRTCTRDSQYSYSYSKVRVLGTRLKNWNWKTRVLWFNQM